MTSLSKGCSPGKGTWSHDSVTGKVSVVKTTVAPSDSTPEHFPRNICFQDVFEDRTRSISKSFYFYTTTNRQAKAEVFDIKSKKKKRKKKNTKLSRCLALFEITELRSKLLGNHNCDN